MQNKAVWKGSLEGWTRRFIAKQSWRVDYYMEADDLYQECWLKYRHLCAKYPAVEPKHFQALYMRAAHNLLNDKATHRTKHRTRFQLQPALPEPPIEDSGLQNLVTKDFMANQSGPVGEVLELLQWLKVKPSDILRDQESILKFCVYALNRDAAFYKALLNQLKGIQANTSVV